MSAAPAPHAADLQEVPMTPELTAYYADKRLLLRNMFFIQLGWWGHGVCFSITGALTTLHLKACGMDERTFALLNSINGWAVSFLVMYFSWRSDHTVSRLGRRLPYLLVSMPFVVASVALVPYFENLWSLIILYFVGAFFMDMKMSTYPLLNIDCVPRGMLGRMWAVNAIVNGVSGFVVVRYGMRLAESHPHLPFLLGAAVLLAVTLATVLGVKEPPIKNPTTASFKPWSTFAVGFRDKRIIWLMLGAASIHGFMQMFNGWNLLWATNETHGLALSKSEYGDAVSWSNMVPLLLALPTGWLIDRVSGFIMVTVLWLLQFATFAYVCTQVYSAGGLMVASLLMAVIGPIYTAADIMVYKNCPPKDVGSVTSSSAFIRQMYNACLGFAAGWMIVAGGTDKPDYFAAFSAGIAMSSVGLCLFAVYRWSLARRNPLTGSP